ncbi:MAG: lipoyl synthase [Oscillospiraceae bacterium]|nr:lipoyl synthase [Oscillospiraceae bacterium]
MERKPDWLRKAYIPPDNEQPAKEILSRLRLNTVCGEAECPNRGECYARHTATFMILGARCTRNCRFCSVCYGAPDAPDPDEPERVARAAAELGLKYVVITSVTRDDLPDGGASHFAATVRAIKKVAPGTAVELLIPDFLGDLSALQTVVESQPDVLGHNMETVRELYSVVRPGADYVRSLAIIAGVKQSDAGIFSKTGIMLGLGEKKPQLLRLFSDLRRADCDFLTLGQYLSPTKAHLSVVEYIHPEIFDEYKETALVMGFRHVASGPYVRSSYNAQEAIFGRNSRIT